MHSTVDAHIDVKFRRVPDRSSCCTVRATPDMAVGSLSSRDSLGGIRRGWSRASAVPAGVGRLEIIAGAGHFTWLDAPDRYWPIIIDFIQTVTARGRAEP